jgi:hypothetical protein
MHVKKVIELLNQSSNGHLIQKAIGKIVADFINDKFSSSEINPMKFTGYQIKLLKLSQVTDQDLLKSYLSEEKGNSLCISKVNNYITRHYFTLIRVCKSLTGDLISLNDDCMSRMLFYLAPHSLCPELFAPVKSLGETVRVNPENGNGEEECVIS